MKSHFAHEDHREAIVEFHDRARLLTLPGGAPLRIVWIGSSSSRFGALALREENFDKAILASVGSQASTSAPWAHGPEFLFALAFHALRELKGAPASRINPLRTQAGANQFSAPRASNFVQMILVQEDQIERALALASSALPQCWLLTSQGLGANLALRSPATPPPRPILLPPSDESMYFEKLDERSKSTLFEPQLQVDGAGGVHWLWLPACARALGAPPKLSASFRGLRELIAWGDVLGAANKIASNDPEQFIRVFADATLPADGPSATSHRWIPEAVRLAFEALDRRSLLAESIPEPGPRAPSSRL
jgi:hypothetical protein